jgi:hypothetical protein
MMEAVRISETSVDNHFTRQYIPEDNSEYLIIVVTGSNKIYYMQSVTHGSLE